MIERNEFDPGQKPPSLRFCSGTRPTFWCWSPGLAAAPIAASETYTNLRNAVTRRARPATPEEATENTEGTEKHRGKNG